MVYYLTKKYGMNRYDASVILTNMDWPNGICHMADKVNRVFLQFKNDPEKFEEKFGFPMFKETRSGDIKLSTDELLIDLYIFSNSSGYHEVKNNEKDPDNAYKYRFNTQNILYDKGRPYINNNEVVIDKYTIPIYGEEIVIQRPRFKDEIRSCIESLDNYFIEYLEYYDCEIETGFAIKHTDTEVINEHSRGAEFKSVVYSLVNDSNRIYGVKELDIKSIIEPYMQEGYTLSLSMYPGYAIKSDKVYEDDEEFIYGYKIIDEETKREDTLDGGHFVTITDITDEKIIFDSWGEKYSITYDELNKKGEYEIYYTKIE